LLGFRNSYPRRLHYWGYPGLLSRKFARIFLALSDRG
jgi:hypothetical protein